MQNPLTAIRAFLIRQGQALDIVEAMVCVPFVAVKIGKMWAKIRPKARAFRFTIYY